MRYKMIIWAHNRKEEKLKTVNRIEKILNCLSDLDERISARYLTSKSKKEAEEFKVNTKNLDSLLERSISKDCDTVFNELGSRFSFFSSMNNDESSSIQFTVGVSKPGNKNTLVVDLPENLEFTSAFNEKLEKIFLECCEEFGAYWGCITDGIIIKSYDYKYWIVSKPTSVHWMNYFSNSVVDIIGEENFRFNDNIKVRRKNSGLLIRISEMPIDSSVEEDINLLKTINEYLSLN